MQLYLFRLTKTLVFFTNKFNVSRETNARDDNKSVLYKFNVYSCIIFYIY